MKKLFTFLWLTTLISLGVNAQYEWSSISIPADPGSGKSWDLIESMSDDFNYSRTFGAGGYANRTNFGSGGKWYNFYHNAWDGPGYTYWNTSNVSLDGDNLVVTAGYTAQNSKGGTYGVQSGCVTSNSKIGYPAYVESSVSVANISLASCFWLLSPDDTEEIDIIENYGGVEYFKNFTHISHHSFVRSPFTDYQPRDRNSWYAISEITNAGGWGEYCWNGGSRRYMRMGVYWKGPKHFEYYIDGELVRVMYYNAMATNIGGTWQYTYYDATESRGGYIFPTNDPNDPGYSDVTLHTTSTSYSFTTLQSTSNASNGFNVIDTGWFQGADTNDIDGNGVTNEALGFTKDMDIIINIESQTWLQGSTPSNADLNDAKKNQMKVDWVRVYKPVGGGNTDTGGGNTGDGNTGGGNTCATAPAYNGNANSYSPGDRTINGGVLYERTSNGWIQIENCNTGDGNTGDGNSGDGNTGGGNTCATAPAYNGNANSYSPGDRTINGGILYERTANGWIQIENCNGGPCSTAVTYNGNANSYSPGTLVNNGGVIYERTANGWNFVQNCNGAKEIQSLEKASMYPNPANSGDIVTVTGVSGDIFVSSLSGKIIQSISSQDGEVNIDTSNLTSGIYFIQTKSKSFKLIVN